MNKDFCKDIKSSRASVSIDLDWHGRPLIIAFGGIVGGMEIPPFEFFNITSGLCVNKIYLRDLKQSWYHSGLSGVTTNIDETVCFLKKKITACRPSKVVVVGNSMGGYASILFGVLLKADIVHSFSPQSFINKFSRILCWDRRWRAQIAAIYCLGNSRRFLDLKEILKSTDITGEVHVYYSAKNRLDKKHAERLAFSNKVELHTFVGKDHALVKLLRDSGELENILLKSLLQNDSTLGL